MAGLQPLLVCVSLHFLYFVPLLSILSHGLTPQGKGRWPRVALFQPYQLQDLGWACLVQSSWGQPPYLVYLISLLGGRVGLGV